MNKIKDLNKYFYAMETIELESGRVISLTKLNQLRTYGGQYEGLPRYTPLVANELQRQVQGGWGKTIIIDTSAVPIPLSEERKDYYRNHRVRSLSNHSLTSLAPVTCVASFQSSDVAKGNSDDGDFSVLNMIWFQEDFAMPIDPDILNLIKSVDWDTEAENWLL